MLPLDVQAASVEFTRPGRVGRSSRRCGRARTRWRAVAAVLAGAERPAIIAGRGAVLSGAGPALRRLGELTGAVLATSAVANGLFADDPFAVGISGGFASPTAQRLLGEADVVDRLRRLAERLDDAPRRARVGRDRDPGRPRRGGDRRAPAGRPGRRRRRARDRRGARRGAHRPRPRRRARRWRAPQRRARGGDRRRRAGATSRTSRRATGSTRGRSRSRSTSCCRPSAPWSSTPARSWATRRCTCASRTRRASSSRRPSSASGWAWATRSARRSRGPTG